MVKLKETINGWAARSLCKKRELLSLVGILSFASKVVKPGRTFLRWLIDLSTTTDSLEGSIVFSEEARRDVLWWAQFVQQWNGKAMFQLPIVTNINFRLFTDASNVGMGGFWRNRWFSVAWQGEIANMHINVKEMFAVAAAIFTWGEQWTDRQIVIFSDNKAVVDIWAKGCTRDKNMMTLIRRLFFFLAQYNINVNLQHVYGYNNATADALSRLQIERFRRIQPAANRVETVVPVDIWDISSPKGSFF